MAIYYVNGKRFNTDNAELVATSRMPFRDAGWDGGTGRWTNLYRTKKGNWVLVHVTCWQGERCWAELISEKQARNFILEYGNKETVEKYCKELEDL
jgi:hypothetical protein